MSNNSKIRFVVIGAGHIGKRHAEMIRRDAEGELVAMVDIRTKKECAAEDFDVPFFSTMEERQVLHDVQLFRPFDGQRWQSCLRQQWEHWSPPDLGY